MNYRHIYHAGNFADILKHAILARILLYLQKKDKPYWVLDSHAGIGLYDLESVEAGKTCEWQEGLGRLMGKDADPIPDDVRELLAPYFEQIEQLNPDGRLRTYPGSPALIQGMAREQDRHTFIEKHPEDVERLKANIGRDRNAQIREDDGWVALRSDLPPKERRGVVLVDPPFEEEHEYQRMIHHFQRGFKRWATGTYCLWYPIKARRDVEEAVQYLKDMNVPNILRAELVINKLDTAKRLNGTGLFIINPPYVLHQELQILLPFLAKRLGQSAARHHLEWISEPK
ncbi:MAG: 23S rRNA (adenine(2030)-N(6))-methyltransferase RlmJ [Cohaesibacter sp.]|jgi:23S rRNA (adenine2030-N6)-methyltransferase|nr:23S rRNA (adenine(2030)-N(6))-methyltransferase RlmJ [Cohaesibacter sp.]